MPELPEVETTVRGLRKHIAGRTIVSAWTENGFPVKTPGSPWKEVKKAIEGGKISSVTRRAKYIVIGFKGGGNLYIHQKMTGHLLNGKWKYQNGKWQTTEKGPLSENKNQHIRAIFTLNNGQQVALSDMRRFATITYVQDPERHEHIRKLGPEPLDISPAGFNKLFDKKRGVLKSVLMDPHFIAGIGNIYADEILWASYLHPLSRVESLEGADRSRILKNAKIILSKAIKMGGSSVDDYRTSSGEKGAFQNMHNAYQLTGEKCRKNDGGVIERIVVGQRSSYFCPVHQKIIR